MNNKYTFHKFVELKPALEFMNQNSETSRIIAGGTDILIEIRKEDKKLNPTDHIIDIHDIPTLRKIKIENNFCILGACCTHSEISTSKIIGEYFPVFKMAVDKIGSPQIRNVATIGGNICNLAACADSIAPLLVYDANVRLCSTTGDRIVPLEKILLKPYITDVQPDEILAEILLPLPEKNWKYCFYKLGRRSGVSISRLSYAIMLRSENNTIQEVRFAFGALFSVPKRLYTLEKELVHQTISNILWKDVSRKVASKILDETGVRWSTSYKIPVIQQLLYKSLMDLT